MKPADARATLEDARPAPRRESYDRDEVKPVDCGCRKHSVKAGCVRHDPMLRRAA